MARHSSQAGFSLSVDSEAEAASPLVFLGGFFFVGVVSGSEAEIVVSTAGCTVLETTASVVVVVVLSFGMISSGMTGGGVGPNDTKEVEVEVEVGEAGVGVGVRVGV